MEFIKRKNGAAGSAFHRIKYFYHDIVNQSFIKAGIPKADNIYKLTSITDIIL